MYVSIYVPIVHTWRSEDNIQESILSSWSGFNAAWADLSNRDGSL